MRNFFKTSLWRLSGPAISLMGQLFAVSANIDVKYQRQVFFVLAAQVIISSIDYPYFIAARKRPRLRVPEIYLPLSMALVTAVFFIGWIDSIINFSYCMSLLLLIIFFAKIYTSEIDSSIFRTTVLGIFRNSTITILLLLYVTSQVQALVVVTALLCTVHMTAFLKRSFAPNLQLQSKSTLQWGELIYCLVAAGLTGIFFLIDRQVIVALHPEHTHLINQLFVFTSVILLFSNIWAVNQSSKVTINSCYSNTYLLWYCALLAAALILALCELLPYLIAFCLIITPLAFAIQSPRLLAIQERITAQSTMIGYIVIIILKILCFWIASNLSAIDWLVYMVPLVGALCPYLILKISKSSAKLAH